MLCPSLFSFMKCQKICVQDIFVMDFCSQRFDLGADCLNLSFLCIAAVVLAKAMRLLSNKLLECVSSSSAVLHGCFDIQPPGEYINFQVIYIYLRPIFFLLKSAIHVSVC